jgi:hypothetical protein
MLIFIVVVVVVVAQLLNSSLFLPRLYIPLISVAIHGNTSTSKIIIGETIPNKSLLGP